jgi:glycosyltransferase involved in cell wall biosynthesis
LLLEGEIRRRIDDSPQARHLIVSFYATVSGLIAQQLALELGLPHLAAVRGSDFHRDYRSPYHFHILRFIAENAQVIVTTNHEQARSLQRSVSTQARFVTIHNSTDAPPDRPLWSPPRCDVVRLFADCGFSVKKATHLLLRSVAELVGRGLPVTLTLAGSLADAGQDYWIGCRDRFESEHPGVFSFPGLIDTDEVDESLQGSHIYCSASLSEGCSNARIRALTLGIPIVTTRCGALPEIAAEAAHVRLCPPADLSALTAALETAVRETLEGGIAVDAGPVRRWREHFSPLRERQQWRQAALEAIAGGLRRSP